MAFPRTYQVIFILSIDLAISQNIVWSERYIHLSHINRTSTRPRWLGRRGYCQTDRWKYFTSAGKKRRSRTKHSAPWIEIDWFFFEYLDGKRITKDNRTTARYDTERAIRKIQSDSMPKFGYVYIHMTIDRDWTNICFGLSFFYLNRVICSDSSVWIVTGFVSILLT